MTKGLKNDNSTVIDISSLFFMDNINFCISIWLTGKRYDHIYDICGISSHLCYISIAICMLCIIAGTAKKNQEIGIISTTLTCCCRINRNDINKHVDELLRQILLFINYDSISLVTEKKWCY